MFDIHCHILPGIDDGSKDIEDSIKMCENAAEDEVKYIIATPHFIESDSEIDKALVLKKVDILNQKISEAGLDISIYPGMEIFVSNNLFQLYEQNRLLTLNNSKYILIEFPLYNGLPNYIEDVMFNLQLNGLIPIIAHPERCRSFIGHPNNVFNLIEKGCLMQVNSGSIEGFYGKDVQKASLSLIKHNMVHFIASDNHSSTGRMVKLKNGYDIVRKKFGKPVADMLYFDNPGKIFNNQDISIDDPVRIVKKRFLFFQ